MVVLDAVSVCPTGVAGWLAESRCVKREVSRPQVADGYGRGSCEGQLLDADMGPQRRLRSTSGLPSRHGTAMWLGCYGDAMRRRWEGVVVRGARGLTFTENGPFIRDTAYRLHCYSTEYGLRLYMHISFS